MDGNGVMQDVRELLSQGLAVPEIIAKGYAPSTVYKVQRDLQRKQGGLDQSSRRSGTAMAQFRYQTQLEAEHLRLKRRVEAVEDRIAQAESRAADLGQLRARIEEIEGAIEEQQRLSEVSLGLQALVERMDAELDGLAKVYEDTAWFEPKWRRRSG